MFRSMNSWPNFTSQNVKKHRKVIYPRPDIFILILFSALFHPHFVIRIFSSAFFHTHFIIRIFLSAIRHPPSAAIRSAHYRDPRVKLVIL